MSEAKETGSNQTAAMAILLGLTVLLVAVFLSSRGEDIGRLPQFISGFFRGGFFSLNGFGASLLGLLIAFLIAAAWFGAGNLFTQFFEKTNKFDALTLARKTAFGASFWSLFWFSVGLAKGYAQTTAIVALAFGLGLAIYFAARSCRFSEKSEEKSDTNGFGKCALGLLIFTLLLTLTSALAPPTAKDALLYHAALPKQFVAQGGNQIVEGNIASFLALGVEMQSVWARLLGSLFDARTGETAMGATVFMFAPLLVLAVYGWAREFEIGKNWARLAALLVAAIPTFYAVASSIYVDLALALYVTLAIHAVGKWWTSLETKWLWFAAIALGAASSIKLTTVFVVAALALIVLLRAREAQNDETSGGKSGSVLLKGFAIFAFAGLLASPWYLRTWAKTGSPIFPFYMNLWKGAATGWDAERSALFQAMNSNYGGAEKGVFHYLLAPVKISLFAQPEIAEYYDGVIGVSFLLGLILIVWAWRRFAFSVELKIAVGVAGIFFLFWLFSSEQLRYLLPIVPGLAVATVISVKLISAGSKTFEKTIYGCFLATSLAGILTSAAWFAEKNPLPVVLGGETRDEYLTRRLDYYEYYRIINNDLPPDARVWLINMRRDSYNLERDFFSDYLFEDWTLKKLAVESKDINEMRQKARAEINVTHVLARRDDLLNLVPIKGEAGNRKKVSIFDQDDNVENKRSESENRAKLKMTEDFVLDKTNQIRADEKFSLVKLP